MPKEKERDEDTVEVMRALRRDEWEGAMDAWAKVEQRLGR